MKRLTKMLLVSSIAALSLGSALLPTAADATISVGPVVTVTGTASAGGYGRTVGVSCPQTNNCVAVGVNQSTGWVARQFNGTWLGAVNLSINGLDDATGRVLPESISCASINNCLVGGEYSTQNGYKTYLDSMINGVWSNPVTLTLPGDSGNYAEVTSVSCTSAGNCAAVGPYNGGSATFAVNEASGVWGTPTQIGTSLTPTYIRLNSVSCSAIGACSAGGSYSDGSSNHAIVVNETGGTWGSAQVVGTLLSGANQSYIVQVSCSSPGNCGAVGNDRTQVVTNAFVINEVHGIWQMAHAIATNLQGDFSAVANSISCRADGDCTVVGGYGPNVDCPTVAHSSVSPHLCAGLRSSVTAHGVTPSRAFSNDEVRGTWRLARTMPGLGAYSYSEGLSVSCATHGNCLAAGVLNDSNGFQAFVSIEENGAWHNASVVASAENTGFEAFAVTAGCANSGYCSAGGFYRAAVPQVNVANQSYAFVLNARVAGPTTVVVPFAFDKSVLNNTLAKQVLAAAVMIKDGGASSVVATGYTDSIGTPAHNLPLSLARANTVRTALLKALGSLGVNNVTVKAVGKGATNFVASNATPAGQAKNRRVELTF